MTAVLQYVRRLILVIFMVQVGKLLAPDGDLKPYVNFVCGLLIIMAVIQPLADLVPSVRQMEMKAAVADLAAVGQEDEPPSEALEGRRRTESLTEELFLQHIAQLLSAELQQLEPLRKRDLTVRVRPSLSTDEDQPAAQLTAVDVYVSDVDSDQVAEAQQTDSDIMIEPIPTISLVDDTGSESEAPDMDAPPDDEVPAEVREAILQHLHVKYRVDSRQIRIRREDY